MESTAITAAPKKKLILCESKAYEKFFKDFMDWCKTTGNKPITKDLGVIKAYMKDLKHGYPDNKTPRKVETLKIKLTAIKRTYEVNGVVSYIDFKSINTAVLESL